MYLRWIVDLRPTLEATRKAHEIIERNKEAKMNVGKLRRQLRELMKEAETLGLLRDDSYESISECFEALNLTSCAGGGCEPTFEDLGGEEEVEEDKEKKMESGNGLGFQIPEPAGMLKSLLGF